MAKKSKSASTVTSAEENSIQQRRKFLKTAGKAAVTVPAVALLLSAGSKKAGATPVVSGGEPIP